MFFQCNIKTDMSTLETWGSAMMDLRNRLVDFQTQTDKIVDLLSLRNANANQSAHMADLNSPAVSGSSIGTHSSKPPTLQLTEEEFEEPEVRPLTEAELQRCPSLSIPKINQMPSIVLLPESTGFE